jgi:hypothetical protein
MEDEEFFSFLSDVKKVEEEHEDEVQEKRPSKRARSDSDSRFVVEETIAAPSAVPVKPLPPPTPPPPPTQAASSSSFSSSGAGAGAVKHPSGFSFATSSTTTSSKSSKTTQNAKVGEGGSAVGPTNPNKGCLRVGGGEKWVDPTLRDWPENDFRLFVGDIGPDCQEKDLDAMFSEFKSYAMSRVVRTKWDNKSKGYGFVSFLDPHDAARALREKNGKYVGPRPIKLTKSEWLKRDVKVVQKEEQRKKKVRQQLGL